MFARLPLPISITPAIWLAAAAPQALAADGGHKAVPPPVPLYASHVSKTSLLAPGIVVIDTADSFDTVLGWYRANLNDRMADVVLGPHHQHFLTHSGAGVDISEAGSGTQRYTKISLLWKPSGGGAYAALAPAGPEQKTAVGSSQPSPAAPPNPPPEKIALTAPQRVVVTATPQERTLPQLRTQEVPVEPPPEKIALTAPQARMDFEAMPQQQALPALTTQQVPEEPPPEKVALARLQSTAAVERAGLAGNLPQLKTTLVAPPRTVEVPAHEEFVEPRSEAGAKGDEAKGLAFFRNGQYAEALLTWEDAAGAGNSKAALFLGMMYDAGEGVPQSYPQALNWYRIASEGGDASGSFNLGVLYDAGFGVHQDPAVAADLYAQAASKGMARAAFNLALLLENGEGVAQDPDGATRYFRQAARSGIGAARAHLGERRAAPAEDMDQSFNTVHDIVPASRKGTDRAVAERIEAAASRGDSAAQYDMAYRLERGTVGDVDLSQAYTLYTLAATASPDSRLRAIASAGASQVRKHLNTGLPKP